MTEETRKRLVTYAEDFGARILYDENDDICNIYADNFWEGTTWFRNHIWHSSDEQPQPGRELIVLTAKGIKIYPNPSNSKMAWDFFVRITHVEHWAYSEDILPDTEDKIEKDPFFIF